MSEPTPPKPRQRMAGNAPIALLTLAGPVIGGLFGQPVIGLLAGFGLGVLIAIAIWLMGPR